MKGKILATLVCFLAASSLLAQAAQSAQTKPIVWPTGDIKWVDMQPGPPGIKVADLWGDHTKGAFGAIVKFPAGFAAPLHTHTNAYKIVVLSGTFIQGPEGKPEFRLGPGSYLYQPGDGYKHTTACDKASECTFLIDSPGMFDLKPVEAAKAPAKK